MKRRQALYFLLITVAAYLALYFAVPYLTVKSKAAMAAALIFSTIFFMGLQIAIVRWVAELRLSWKTAIPMFFISAALFVTGFVLIATGQHNHLMHLIKDPKLLGQLKAQKPSIQFYGLLYGRYHGPLIPLMNLLLISAAGSLGYFVSFLLKERNIILPVAAFSGFTDFWTVSVGPTSKMVKHAPQVVQAVSAQIPTPGAHHLAPVSFIGPGDFVFLALLFGAICRHGMNARRTYWFVFPLLTLGMLGVIIGGGLFGLPTGFPALVLVALGVVLANAGEFKLQKSEVKAVLAVAGVILALVLILTPILTRKP